MNKKIAIIGGSQFQELVYNGSTYEMNPNYSLISLPKDHEIDNFSNKYMTSKRALRLVDNLIDNKIYDSCVLGLGELELNNFIEFKYNMEQIIMILKQRNIEIVIVNLPEYIDINDSTSKIHAYLDYLCNEYNVDLISESYNLINNGEINQVNIDLCF